MAVYRGYLGTLNPEDVVAPIPSFIPATTPGYLPLLGLEGTPAHPQPVMVKVDNARRAAPHSGLNDADIVIEEEVEWGITRFAAIFHSRNAVVGPVRSGRTTDLNFLPALGQPAFVYSGANTLTDQLLRRLEAVDNRSAARNGSYWRQSGRRAPSNLFTDTASFRSNDINPAAFLHYRDTAVPVVGIPSTSLSIDFGSTDAQWDWNGSAWLRSQNGKQHMTTSGAQVSAASVIVVWVRKVDTGMVDSAGGVVPELILLGSGPATVLIDGKRVGGEWMRASLNAPLTIVDPEGNPIGATPGRTWIELVTQDDIVL